MRSTVGFAVAGSFRSWIGWRTLQAIVLTCVLTPASIRAATFFVPSDHDMVGRSEAIVVGEALSSYTRLSEYGGVETVTAYSVREALKGSLSPGRIEIVEPGGTYKERSTIIPGIPQFRAGEESLLFLRRAARGAWVVTDLVLGKFTFETDDSGKRLAVRDEAEINGWSPDGRAHKEQRRAAERFLAYLARVAKGETPEVDYVVDYHPLRIAEDAVLTPVPHVLYSGKSYTAVAPDDAESDPGARWPSFASARSIYIAQANGQGSTTEAGAPGNGVTGVTTAIASWNNDAGSTINYAYNAGAAPCAPCSGLAGSDGTSTITFESNLAARFGAPGFTCSQQGYSGLLGLGGTNSLNTHTGPNGDTFSTAVDGDVEMNVGIANCTLLFNNGDWNSALTHELGHTLGLRHSNQNRRGTLACSADDCADTAIMKSFIPNNINAALQGWDQRAVAALYPPSVVSPPSAPVGVVATATTTTSVSVTWTSTAGATSYQVDRMAPGGSFVQVGTPASNAFTDNLASAGTAYLYRVRAVNEGGASGNSAADLATTVIFTDTTLSSAIKVKAAHLSELRTAVSAVRVLAGQGVGSYTDAASSGTLMKALHVTELRTQVDAARLLLGLTNSAYTDASLSGVKVKSTHFQELRTRVQ